MLSAGLLLFFLLLVDNPLCPWEKEEEEEETSKLVICGWIVCSLPDLWTASACVNSSFGLALP